MPTHKTTNTNKPPKSDTEALKGIRQVIKDWQLLRGAISPPDREQLLDLITLRSNSDYADRSKYLLSNDVYPDGNAMRRIRKLPNEDEAMAKIEAILGMNPKGGEKQLDNRWKRWFSRHLVPYPRDPEKRVSRPRQKSRSPHP